MTGTDKEKEEAAKHFAEINHAYESLSDTEKRQIYDQYGEEGLRQHAGQQVGQFNAQMHIHMLLSCFCGAVCRAWQQQQFQLIIDGASLSCMLLFALVPHDTTRSQQCRGIPAAGKQDTDPRPLAATLGMHPGLHPTAIVLCPVVLSVQHVLPHRLFPFVLPYCMYRVVAVGAQAIFSTSSLAAAVGLVGARRRRSGRLRAMTFTWICL